jgi:regulator of protease activity HflC (stomatin/prohibitin superfamily)
MESILSILAPMVLVLVGYGVGSTKIINEGDQALVERLGKFKRKLEPGLNFIVPFVDKIAVEATIRERVLDTQPQQAITKDNVAVGVDAVVFWQIVDLKNAYYAVEDVELAIENLVLTTLRAMIGELDLDQTYSSRTEMNRKLLEQLAEATQDWGIEVKRVEVQDISPPKSVLEELERERAAESRKKAEIYDAEGTVESLKIISQALQGQPNSREVVQFLIAQRYVDANQKLGESTNSKIVFMDPKALTEAMTDLIGGGDTPGGERKGNGSISPQDRT